MKTFFVLLLVAGLGGSAWGWYLSASAYVWPEERFGPFSTANDLQPQQLDAYFAKIRPQALPKLEIVGGAEYDFGVMLRGEEGECEFALRNVGDADLEVEVTGATCKCTVGSLDKSVLAPGESTTVQLNWTVKTSASRFSQSANLRTTDPDNSELKLGVSGKVVDRIDPVPAYWNQGETAAGAAITVSSTVYNRYDHDLEFVEAHWTQPQIEELAEVRVEPRSVTPDEDEMAYAARQAFAVAVTIPPGLSQGRLSETLRLRFRHQGKAKPQEEVVNIELSARIVGPISLLGGPRLSGRDGESFVFDMGRLQVGEGRTDKVYVVLRGEHRENDQLSVGEIEPASVLAASLGEPVAQGAFVRYPLELTIKKDAPAGERLGKNKDDYGIVTIESKSDQIAPLRLRIEYSVGGPSGSR